MNLKVAALVAVGLLVLGAIGGALFVRLGIYDIAATRQHTAFVFWLLEQGKTWSVRQRAEEVAVPDLSDAAAIETGMRHYQAHCVQCHGAPGIPRAPFSQGMTPVPSNLVETARLWTSAEIFWTVKHGIKMTGMPGWDYRMADDEIWTVVAFVKQMPAITPADYRRRIANMDADPPPRTPAEGADEPTGSAPGDPERGEVAIRQYGCPACHVIPGIVGSDTKVGPPLRGMSKRTYIAGVLQNTPANMIRWLRDPPAVDPLTAMPDLGVSAAHARDMAAYLDTLD